MITLEGFDKLLVLVKDDITKEITNMSDASSQKLKLAAKLFHVHSFVVLLIFSFHDQLEHVLFFKNLIKQNCFKFCCMHYQTYLIQ